MKTISLSVILFLVPIAAAGEKNWEEKKAKKLANIEQKIVALQEMKSCIQNATTRPDFKACKEKHKIKMKSLKGNKKK